jgi:Zn-dependent M16 (insulinase) family peptidase
MDDYLQDFDARPSDTAVAWQTQRYSQPLQTVHPYPASPDQPDTHMLTLNWLLHDRPLSATQELTLNILDHLLLGTSSSILRKTLMESGLGTALTGGGLSDELLQATFSVGLKGVAPNNTQAVETLILETLAQIAKDGFTQQAMAASMNTIEFAVRTNKTRVNKSYCVLLQSLIEWFGINTATGIQHWVLSKGTFLHAG